MLDLSGLYHSADGGITAIYAADGRTITSGAAFSEVVGDPSGN